MDIDNRISHGTQQREEEEEETEQKETHDNQHFCNCRHRKYYTIQWTKLFANVQQFAQAAKGNL